MAFPPNGPYLAEVKFGRIIRACASFRPQENRFSRGGRLSPEIIEARRLEILRQRDAGVTLVSDPLYCQAQAKSAAGSTDSNIGTAA